MLLIQSPVTSVTLKQRMFKGGKTYILQHLPLPTHYFPPDYFLREGDDSEQSLS